MRFYRTFLAAAAAAAAVAMGSSAQAATIYSNNFDSENGGASQLNYNSFDGLGVSFGTVDLVRSGEFLVTCVGGIGSCVDLDGTFDGGRATSSLFYSFLAGDVITLAFDVSGNQRIPTMDDIGAGFTFSSRTILNEYTRLEGANTFNFGTLDIDPENSDGSIQTSYSSLAQNDPFAMRGIRFTAGNAGSLRFFVQNVLSNDSFGPVLDNLSLDVSTSVVTAVPEPDTWMMMIVGFGAIGYAMRRRAKVRTDVSFA